MEVIKSTTKKQTYGMSHKVVMAKGIYFDYWSLDGFGNFSLMGKRNYEESEGYRKSAFTRSMHSINFCLFVFPNDKEKQCLNFLYSQVGQPLFTYIIPVSDCVCSMNVSEFSSNGKQTPSHEISLAFCLIQNI